MKRSMLKAMSPWMRQFEILVVHADAKHAGKIDWATARFMFFDGRGPERAAEIYVADRKDSVPA